MSGDLTPPEYNPNITAFLRPRDPRTGQVWQPPPSWNDQHMDVLRELEALAYGETPFWTGEQQTAFALTCTDLRNEEDVPFEQAFVLLTMIRDLLSETGKQEGDDHG